jgi:hypothetical protein
MGLIDRLARAGRVELADNPEVYDILWEECVLDSKETEAVIREDLEETNSLRSEYGFPHIDIEEEINAIKEVFKKNGRELPK